MKPVGDGLLDREPDGEAAGLVMLMPRQRLEGAVRHLGQIAVAMAEHEAGMFESILTRRGVAHVVCSRHHAEAALQVKLVIACSARSWIWKSFVSFVMTKTS